MIWGHPWKAKDGAYHAPGGKAEFQEAIRTVNAFLKETNDPQEKKCILDYTMEVVRNDLKYDLLTRILYSRDWLSPWEWPPFPVVYFNEKGERLETFKDENGLKIVDLAVDCVLSIPWDKERLRRSIQNIGTTQFQFDNKNHTAYYFEPLNICYVAKGLHSTAAGIGLGKGYIQAVKYDISVLFNHVRTDGKYWYGKHNVQTLGMLRDFRIGILFELACIRQNLEMG